jgi:hypothetical protein
VQRSVLRIRVQTSATGCYNTILFLRSIISCHPFLGLPDSRFYKDVFIKTFVLFIFSTILATCLIHRSLPNFTILATLGDEYKSQSSSLCDILKRQYNSISLRSRYFPEHIYNFCCSNKGTECHSQTENLAKYKPECITLPKLRLIHSDSYF